MKNHLFYGLFLLLAISSCKKKNNVDYRSLELVELNPYAPVLDKSKLSNRQIEVKANFKEDSSLTLFKLILDSTKNAICSTNPLGWEASYTRCFDSLNRIDSLLVESCFSWRIGFQYKVQGKVLVKISTINKTERDTSLYYLDDIGRVIKYQGLRYGDLIKFKETKIVHYSDKSSYPDLIITTLKNTGRDTIYQTEKFFKSGEKIDSIRISRTEITSEFKSTQMITNVFYDNEFVSQIWHQPAFTSTAYIIKH